MKRFWNWILRRKPEPVVDPALGPIDAAEQPPAPIDAHGLSVCPDHTASICHLLLHVHTDIASEWRKDLLAGTLSDKNIGKINDRFKFISLGLWGKETTIDDIKYAFSKLAYTSEVK